MSDLIIGLKPLIPDNPHTWFFKKQSRKLVHACEEEDMKSNTQPNRNPELNPDPPAGLRWAEASAKSQGSLILTLTLTP